METSPRRAAALWLLGLAVLVDTAPAVAAPPVFRCEGADGAVSYSQFPCEQAEEQVVVTEGSGHAVSRPAAAPAESETALMPSGTEAHRAPAQPASSVGAAPAPFITEAQLQGTWSDMKEPGPLRSLWTFSSPYLRFVPGGAGETVNARYTLTGNALTVHHAPSDVHPDAWDERIEILGFDGQTLTWDSIARMRLHRLY
jgi:hypothetical protein